MKFFILISLILILGSCGPKLQGYNISSIRNYYVNEDLKISIAFPGNYSVIPTRASRTFQKKLLEKDSLYNNPDLTLLCYTQQPYDGFHKFKDFLFLKIKKKFDLDDESNNVEFQNDKQKYFVDTFNIIANIYKSQSGETFYIDTINLISYFPFSDLSHNNYVLVCKKEKDSIQSFSEIAQLFTHTFDLISNISTGPFYLKELPFSDPFEIAESDFWYPSGGNYLGAIEALEKVLPTLEKSSIINIYWKMLSQYYELTDNSDSALKYYYLAANVKKSLDEKAKKFIEGVKRNATPVILDSVKNHDVIAINENHANPASRYYLASLLSKFKESGFENIGIEALATDDFDSLSKKSYYNGFDTRSSAFTFLISHALKLKLNIFNYEDTTAGPKSFEQRDERQAENIVNKLSKLSSGKTILFCGFAHLSKSIEYKTMVQFLQEKLNKKVFSIDMESLTTAFPDEFSTDTTPLVFLNSPGKNSEVLPNRYKADLQVFIPKSSIIPIKKSLGFKKTVIDLPDSVLNKPIRKAIYVYKYPYTDPAQNQPVFIDVSKLQKQTIAYLQVGEYVLNVVDDRKNVLYSTEIQVE